MVIFFSMTLAGQFLSALLAKLATVA